MSSMNIDMDEDYASPSSLDPQNLTLRERYRRYGKRLSPSPHNETKFSNAALYLDNIKKEVDHRYDEDGDRSSSKRRSLSPEMSVVSHSLKVCKVEELEGVVDGPMSIPDLILRLEAACRNVSESIKIKVVPPRGELPTTSHLDACQFVADDHNAQLCFRLVQWLEGLASKALDLENKVRGSHVGTHLPTSGVWNHTQRFLKKGSMNEKIVQHLDFDASTREHAQPLPDDKVLISLTLAICIAHQRQDESLLEDVWILLRAGRLEEACNLCRAAGQSWRAATLRPFGGMDHTPSVEALIRNGKDRSLQAMELESEQESGKYETAIYAANCSNVKRILPICTDWEEKVTMVTNTLHIGVFAHDPHLPELDLLCELARFQTGVTMEIMRVDAWYSGSDGSLGNPATYILRGLSRRCCIPELILRCMQVSVSLMETGNAHESHDELIELVASSETGILHLFSQNQLQEFLMFEREYCIWKMELLGESAV
ncbi:hypothetical protein CTI12_AA037420 [Artemisia annua]|uniref:Nuclear pore complex protein n=1 Tax=Artemisia annua TaxID=35608 RepID=A0A2U1QF99_ARTAN|nr:hypothetical protein CTI12_AA037420 [Artemisia annua]